MLEGEQVLCRIHQRQAFVASDFLHDGAPTAPRNLLEHVINRVKNRGNGNSNRNPHPDVLLPLFRLFRPEPEPHAAYVAIDRRGWI